MIFGSTSNLWYNYYNSERRVDGAIIAIDKAEHRGELSFLYVKVGIQSKGIGQAIWNAIEALHPETEVWEKRMKSNHSAKPYTSI